MLVGFDTVTRTITVLPRVYACLPTVWVVIGAVRWQLLSPFRPHWIASMGRLGSDWFVPSWPLTGPSWRGLSLTRTFSAWGQRSVRLPRWSANQTWIAWLVNVGDSRVYRYSRGGLIQVTEDHSLVADLVRAGDLTAEEAARHPQRNILTRALGIEDDPVVDTWELLPVVGDRYLLCSDGLFNELTDDRISEILGQCTDPKMAANELVNRAVDAGGHDNVTVLVVDVTEVSGTGGEGWTLPGVRPEQASAAAPSDMIGLGGRGWRPVALGVGLMGLLAAVFAGIGLYARSGWYVGEYNGGVAVFKGRPSGVLWFNPTVEEVMGVSILDLQEPQRKAVVDVIVVASLSEGRDLVERLSSNDD